MHFNIIHGFRDKTFRKLVIVLKLDVRTRQAETNSRNTNNLNTSSLTTAVSKVKIDPQVKALWGP